MRLTTVISLLWLAATLSGCNNIVDNGYLSPPVAVFDQHAALQQAHIALGKTTYLGVTDRRQY